MSMTTQQQIEAAVPAAPSKGRGRVVVGWFLAGFGVLCLFDAANMRTTVPVSPSLDEASAAIAAGIDPVVRQVPDDALVGKQLVSAISGGALLLAGAVFIARRR